MKKIKFFACLMTMFMGLSFGMASCGDDDEESNGDKTTIVTEDEVINEGRTFYKNLNGAVNRDEASILAVVSSGMKYYQNKSDKAWTTNFLAGVVMEKYGVADATVAKSEEYMSKVADLKAILDNGITADNISNLLIDLASFISKK
ncbi:MAG: hypothetical protein MJZ14_05800 [Paludibacteraceae bacterium]|nr:hypothetical protein [Paludibacteraceae bacterium]